MSSSFCKGTSSIEPTPTPYQEQINIKPQNIKIQALNFTPNCKVSITNSINEISTFNLPNDRTISNTICPVSVKSYQDANQNFAVFENLSNPKSPGITLYILSLNKVVTLENYTNDYLLDALFLSDNHLVTLFRYKIKTYDLNNLIKNYPGNIDFYQNKFKSITLESTEIRLENLTTPETSLVYENNQINGIDLVRLYPRSSCPCWDTTANYCLPQSACLHPQTP